ncbi:MAG: hypothetical protein K2P78_09290, partial [Gemmataceae bacterium]|nr:hypothetical protein [Gemmataceae bacterium]
MANLPPALVLGLASPAVAWARLVAASLARRQVKRLRAWRAERRRVRLVELPARDAAERAAAERRACLHDFLRGALDLDPEDDVRSPTGVVHEEFREPLPELRGLPGGPFQSDAGRRFEPDEAARFWHTSLLYWQLDADHHLLAGRVLDVLGRLRRGGLLTAADAPTHIRLAPLPDRPSTCDRFPWRVVLGGPALSPRLRDAFDVLRDWLGIGVEFERARPVTLCGLQRPGGVVGGVVAVPGGEQYGVTCRHTLA